MEEVKTTAEYKIFKKRNGRYALVDSDGNTINGKRKSEILFSEKLISVPPPKEEAPVVEAPAPEEAAEAAPAQETKEAS